MTGTPRHLMTGRDAGRSPRRVRPLLTRIVIELFCIELGLILLVLPWTLLWDNNYFFSLQPQLSEFWLSNELRGAVSGVGLVNLWAACRELARMATRRPA